MVVYNYPSPRNPSYKKPTSIEDCLPHARLLSKKQHGRAAMGPVKKGDNLPMGHIHVHNYFVTFEIKIQGTDDWYKIVDKGWFTCMDDSEIRAMAVKYGDPDELLNYDWVPPLPGINYEGDYFKDYAPDPVAFLKRRMKENKSI